MTWQTVWLFFGIAFNRAKKHLSTINNIPAFIGIFFEKDIQDRLGNHFFHSGNHYLLQDHDDFSPDRSGFCVAVDGFPADIHHDPLENHALLTYLHHDPLENHVLSPKDSDFQNYFSGFLNEKSGFPAENSDDMGGASEKL